SIDMNRMFFLSIVAAVALGAAASNAPAQKAVIEPGKADLRQELQQVLDEWHRAGKFPGATVGIVLANGEVISLAVGNSDREARTAMRPADRMLAGSTGKTFAAATALQLVSEGKIGLDDKLSKYLGSEPWFSRRPNAGDITVRQLMNHTSRHVRYVFKDEFKKDLPAASDKVWRAGGLVVH